MEEGKPSVRGQAAAEGPVETIGVERIVRSALLFGGRKEVVIEHDGERYRLRCTSKGKLILTK